MFSSSATAGTTVRSLDVVNLLVERILAEKILAEKLPRELLDQNNSAPRHIVTAMTCIKNGTFGNGHGARWTLHTLASAGKLGEVASVLRDSTAPSTGQALPSHFARVLETVHQLYTDGNVNSVNDVPGMYLQHEGMLRDTLKASIRTALDECDSDGLNEWWVKRSEQKKEANVACWCRDLMAQDQYGRGLQGLTVQINLKKETAQSYPFVLCAWPNGIEVPRLAVADGAWDPSNPLGDPDRATPDCEQAPYRVWVARSSTASAVK